VKKEISGLKIWIKSHLTKRLAPSYMRRAKEKHSRFCPSRRGWRPLLNSWNPSI